MYRQIPDNVKQTLSMFKSINNPQTFIQKIINSNPQIQTAIQSANGNPEQAFRDMCKQMNVDAEEIINMLK